MSGIGSASAALRCASATSFARGSLLSVTVSHHHRDRVSPFSDALAIDGLHRLVKAAQVGVYCLTEPGWLSIVDEALCANVDCRRGAGRLTCLGLSLQRGTGVHCCDLHKSCQTRLLWRAYRHPAGAGCRAVAVAGRSVQLVMAAILAGLAAIVAGRSVCLV